jgi:RNA polymerase sigma factor (sigma-70 family)
MTDMALLDRWLHRRDAEAFNAIIARYAPMVYATSRRVLCNATEAEDVTQECFELLAETSRVPSRHLGGWLHRVATNRARNRVREERRRKEREARFSNDQPTESRVRWDDIYEYVDEAVADLPDDLRIPLVAHFLEGQTHAAVAESLDIPRSTVTDRIAKGLALVGKSLRRHGIAVPVAALAALFTTHMAEATPIPATLGASLGKLALSHSAGVGGATTVLGHVMAGGGVIMAKKIVAGAVVLAVVILLLLGGVQYALDAVAGGDSSIEGKAGDQTVALGSDPGSGASSPWARSGGPDGGPDAAAGATQAGDAGSPDEGVGRNEGDSPEAEKSGEEDSADPAASSVCGYVMNDEAYPIEGAEVNLQVTADPGGTWVLGSNRTVTAGDGFYAFPEVATVDIPAMHGAQFGTAVVSASASGYVTSKRSVSLQPGAGIDGVNFALAEARHFVRGAVLGQDDEPIAEASVGLRQYGYGGEGTGGTVAGESAFVTVLSGADGRFEVAVPEAGLCDFVVRKNGYGPGFFRGVPTGTEDARFTLRGNGSIAGTVRHADESPAPGLTVVCQGLTRPGGQTNSQLLRVQPVLAVTDSTGHYTLEGLGQDFAHAVSVFKESLVEMASLQGPPTCLATRGDVYVKAGQVTEDVDFVLTAGARLHGRVTDKDSGRPVAGVRIYAAVADTASAGQSLGLCDTAEDGVYAIELLLQGQCTVGIGYFYEHPGGTIKPMPPGYVTEVEMGPGDEKALDVAIAAPISIPIRAVDPAGNPVAGVGVGLGEVAGSGDLRYTWGSLFPTDGDGRFLWYGIPPDREYFVWLADRSQHASEDILCSSGVIAGQPGETVQEVVLVVEPKAGLEGVLADVDGNPLAGIAFSVVVVDQSGSERTVQAETDERGVFVIVRAFPEGQFSRVTIMSTARGTLERADLAGIELVRDSIGDLGVVVLEPQPAQQPGSGDPS